MRTEAEILDALAKARANLEDGYEYEWMEWNERERIETLKWVLGGNA